VKQYTNILREIIVDGEWMPNRTGIDTKKINGVTMKFDLRESFPIVTVKKVPFKMIVNEMLCFLRGYNSAKMFRDMGVTVWDQNANENEAWLSNPNRLGEDDLGRIYGVQARSWRKTIDVGTYEPPLFQDIDQVRKVYDHLKDGIDDRREIVTHWNPGELDEMALPPCHLLYQFGLTPIKWNWPDNDHADGIPKYNLNLTMYQRSADMPLGVPFNITGYAWLLATMAHITNTIPARFLHVMHDAHIYRNQLDAVEIMLRRMPRKDVVTLVINPEIKCLEDLESWVTADDFDLVGYIPHPHIKIPMAV